jgi:hypothetical protein
MQIIELMSQDLIRSALYSALSLMDSILQIWLTLTFAVIVSTYVAGPRFDRPVYLLVSGLYAFASAIQLIRLASAAHQAFFYKSLLVARGFEPWPVPDWVAITIGFGSLVLIFAGTLATLWFIRATWKRVAVAGADNASQGA